MDKEDLKTTNISGPISLLQPDPKCSSPKHKKSRKLVEQKDLKTTNISGPIPLIQPSLELQLEVPYAVNPEARQDKGKDFKKLLPYPLDIGKTVDKSQIDASRTPVGRPPRPKQQVVQALLCKTKMKFEDFEPLIETL